MKNREAETIWKRSRDVAFVDEGDRIVLLNLAHPTSAQPLLLDGSGAAVWRALAAGVSVTELCALLPEADEDIQKGLTGFLLLLEGEGLAISTQR